MPFAQPVHPMRAVIRCKAKQQLLCAAETLPAPLDEALFQEITATFFQSNQYQVLYHQCASAQDGLDVEDRVANELALIYRQITNRRGDAIVQHLNTLL